MSSILEEIETQIAGLKTSTVKSNVGVVREAGDGVARVEGLSEVMLNEMIEFPSGEFGLALNLEETEDGADGWFEYATDLFKPETIHAMVEEYVRLLEMICTDPRQKIELLELGLDHSAKTVPHLEQSP